VVAKKSDPWFNHQTTFIFKTRIQYKRDQMFYVKSKQEQDTMNLQEKQLKQRHLI